MTIHTQDRVARRPTAVLVPAVLLMALGVWVFFAPLAGPYFSFGFDTSTHWRFSQNQENLNALYGGTSVTSVGLTYHKAIPWVARFNNWGNSSLDTDGNLCLVRALHQHPASLRLDDRGVVQLDPLIAR